jgi:SAM-dependent methyltransferase
MFDLAANYYAFEDLNHTVVDVLGRLRPSLPDSAALLDIGCGRGQLASAARDLSYRVTGIESHPAALAVAQDRVDKLLPIDLTDQNSIGAALDGQNFDIIHSTDKGSDVCSKTSAKIVVSLPNIACWDRRLALLFGHFDYVDSGIMDRTHLRFFTFRTAQALLREAGLTICSVKHAPGITRAFLPFIKQFFFKSSTGPLDPGEILNSPSYRLYERWVLPAETSLSRLWRGLLSFRIVLVGAVREIN